MSCMLYPALRRPTSQSSWTVTWWRTCSRSPSIGWMMPLTGTLSYSTSGRPSSPPTTGTRCKMAWRSSTGTETVYLCWIRRSCMTLRLRCLGNVMSGNPHKQLDHQDHWQALIIPFKWLLLITAQSRVRPGCSWWQAHRLGISVLLLQGSHCQGADHHCHEHVQSFWGCWKYSNWRWIPVPSSQDGKLSHQMSKLKKGYWWPVHILMGALTETKWAEPSCSTGRHLSPAQPMANCALDFLGIWKYI